MLWRCWSLHLRLLLVSSLLCLKLFISKLLSNLNSRYCVFSFSYTALASRCVKLLITLARAVLCTLSLHAAVSDAVPLVRLESRSPRSAESKITILPRVAYVLASTAAPASLVVLSTSLVSTRPTQVLLSIIKPWNARVIGWQNLARWGRYMSASRAPV